MCSNRCFEITVKEQSAGTQASVAALIDGVDAVQLGHRAAVERVALLTPAARLFPVSAGARRHCCGDVGQTAAKVGAHIVVDERIGARVAVGETVAEDAEDLVGATIRLQPEVDDEQMNVHRQPADGEHHYDRQEDAPRVRRSTALHSLQSLGTTSDSARQTAPTSDQVADDEQVHGGDDEQRNDVGEREEGDEKRRPVAEMVADAAEVVRSRVALGDRLDAVDGQQRRVGGEHRDPDNRHDPRHPPGRRHRSRRRADDGDEANDGDGDEGVDGDVDGRVEDEVSQLAGDVAHQPVVGGVVVRHERDGDHEEDDVADGQIQQQQVDGRPHGATRCRDVDDQRVAEHSDPDDESERYRDDDLVQDVVKPQRVVQVLVDVGHREITPDVSRGRQYLARNSCCRKVVRRGSKLHHLIPFELRPSLGQLATAKSVRLDLLAR